MDFIVEKNNEILRLKGDFKKDLVVDISRKKVLNEDEIETFLVDILSEKEDINDFLSLDKDTFLLYEKEEYVYLDFECPYSILANSEDALSSFMERIKVLIEEKTTRQFIIELIGKDITLIDMEKTVRMIEEIMEESLKSKKNTAEPVIEFGLKLASIENSIGESKVMILCFIGR